MCEGKNNGLNIIRDKEIYEELINVSPLDSKRTLYHVAERDKQKGSRMTSLMRSNGEIQSETKDPRNLYRK